MMDSLERLREEVDLLLNLQDATELRRAANHLLSRLATLMPTAECLYLQGLVAYEHPDYGFNIELQSLVEKALAECITLKPSAETRSLAFLGLGHHFYDRKAYNEAWEAFRSCDPSVVETYLAAKIAEMRLCCQIHMLGVNEVADQLEDTRSVLADLEANDIAPFSLARLLGEIRDEMDVTTLRRFRKFAHDIDRLAGSDNWLSGIITR